MDSTDLRVACPMYPLDLTCLNRMGIVYHDAEVYFLPPTGESRNSTQSYFHGIGTSKQASVAQLTNESSSLTQIREHQQQLAKSLSRIKDNMMAYFKQVGFQPPFLILLADVP